MICALYIRSAFSIYWDEKIKPVALSIVKLCLTGGISQLESKKIHRNLLEGFGIDLKTFLGF